MSKTALLFAGQGAQVAGMGRDLAAAFPSAQALVNRANAILGYDLAQVCFAGPADQLIKTEHAQPGIYLVGWLAFRLLCERVTSLRFEAAAGLSLGEFTALAAAGALAFEDGLRLVRARGRFMQEACAATPGGMAAVIGLEEAPLREVCAEGGVEIANLNCPGQIVIAGATDALARACELAKARGAKRALPLPVAGAYHSRLMAAAQSRLEAELASYRFAEPRVPVIANVTARPHGGAAAIPQLLARQVTAPVRWEESIRHLLAQGFSQFIELGPGTALTGFLRRLDRQARALNVGDLPSLEATVAALRG
jgi:[acyl-carrier-protein] S-malonyltransferase